MTLLQTTSLITIGFATVFALSILYHIYTLNKASSIRIDTFMLILILISIISYTILFVLENNTISADNSFSAENGEGLLNVISDENKSLAFLTLIKGKLSTKNGKIFKIFGSLFLNLLMLVLYNYILNISNYYGFNLIFFIGVICIIICLYLIIYYFFALILIITFYKFDLNISVYFPSSLYDYIYRYKLFANSVLFYNKIIIYSITIIMYSSILFFVKYLIIGL